jgi:hypothetical protein
MIIYILNQSLVQIDLIETFYSLIWTERYSEVGDFELELPIEDDLRESLAFGNFLQIKESDRLMVIENKKPQTGEDSSSLLITGESAEGILKGRIILKSWYINGFVDTFIYDLVHATIIAPTDPEGEIAIFKDTFPAETSTKEHQNVFEVGTIYDIIESICKNTGMGFKVEKEGLELAFSVYEGFDLSYEQAINPYVVFSQTFDNVISSSYYESVKDQVNSILVITDDLEPTLQRVWVYEDDITVPLELDRREFFLETSINRVIADGEPELTDAEVLGIIKARGRAVIRERKHVGLFEGDFDIQGNFEFGIDFYIGDIVQCRIENRNVRARIVELVRSYSTDGETSYVSMDFVI